MFDDEDDQTKSGLVEKDGNEDLLTLVDDSNEELIPVSLNRITKPWLSSNGGLGCFAFNFHEVLADIAAMTGTEISVVDEINGIKVSGQNQGDVDDALAKLTRIEKPLVSSYFIYECISIKTHYCIVIHWKSSSYKHHHRPG